jgi:hypothetical protein
LRSTLTAILIVISLLMLDVRAGVCQEAATSRQLKTAEVSPPQQQQSPTGQSRGTTPGTGQTLDAALDDKARKIKRTIEKIGVAGRLTLYLKNGEELYGSVVSYDAESLQIAEIDLKQVVAVQYRNVKKVREGYSNPNPFTGKRTNPPKGVRIGAALAAVLAVTLVVPIIVLATIKD